MRHRYWMAIVTAAMSAALLRCNELSGLNDLELGVCIPNEAITCLGAGRCSGVQTCGPDRRWLSCVCETRLEPERPANDGAAEGGTTDTDAVRGGGRGNGSGGSASVAGGSAGSGGAGSAGTGAAGAGDDAETEGANLGLLPGGVGTPCSTDSDCAGAPLTCIPSSSNAVFQSGGPQDGYCSLPCTTSQDCLTVDGTSLCSDFLGTCLAACLAGESGVKCGNGRALACVQSAPEGTADRGVMLGACVPRCTSDAACGPGRFCDLGLSGLCVDAPPPGRRIGEACTEDADCSSQLCLTLADAGDPALLVASFCGAACTFGSSAGCGFEANTSLSRSAACLTPALADGQPGDLGLCIPLCDTSNDCAQASGGWLCEPLSPETAAATRRQGTCQPPS